MGPTNPGNPNVIRAHQMGLRQNLGEDGANPTYICTKLRVGSSMG